MRFDSKKYDELFPRIEKTEMTNESMIETFRSTENVDKHAESVGKNEAEKEAENLDSGPEVRDPSEDHG